MSEAPARHQLVPADAVWLPEVERWEVRRPLPASGAAPASDTTDTPDTELRQFRADGSLYLVSGLRGGVNHGPFQIFHPGGQLAREGRYQGGNLDGEIRAYVSEADPEGGEPLRSCCVPDNARALRSHYEAGQLVSDRFFDGEGHLLLGDGRRCPERPAGLSEDAQFDESENRWAVPPARGPGPEGPWRFFDLAGRLIEEARFEAGLRVWSRRYAAQLGEGAGAGELLEEVHLTPEGKRHGPYLRRFAPGEATPYRDDRVREVRGAYADDLAVGSWTFHDGAGQLLRSVDHGRPITADGPFGPAFADELRLPEAWSELGESLLAEGRPAEALCAFARAAARRDELDELLANLARHTVALAPAEAVALAEKATAVEENPLPGLLAALLAGGEPAALFRGLATAQRDCPYAGRDFADASLLLDPQQPMSYLTRALLRLELGDDRGALADGDRLGQASPESRAFVRDYARLLLPEWGFWPLRERFEGQVEGVPDAPAQPLPALRRQIQVYATRLGRLRDAVLARVPRRKSAAWIPPALPELLPDGPLELRRYQGTITDETDAGPETVTVEVDETLDPTGAGLPALMRVARAHWAALTTLCWAAGLTRVALPTALTPPEGFAAAAGAAITRFFRIQDVLVTGGLRSQTAGVPSFIWEGLDVDEMPRPFAQLAADEYFELRALYLWLLSAENLSPFQSDLREVA